MPKHVILHGQVLLKMHAICNFGCGTTCTICNMWKFSSENPPISCILVTNQRSQQKQVHEITKGRGTEGGEDTPDNGVGS